MFRTLLLAHHVGVGHAIDGAISAFCEGVSQRTEGQIRIATLPDSQVGNLPAQLQMVIDGRADMALPPHDRFSRLSPKFGCVGLPFAFDDAAHADRVLNGEFRDWAMPDLAAHGLQYLGSWEWGFRQISNIRHPIISPDDLSGLRIRIPPVQNLMAAILALEGIPVVTEYSHLLKAIRRGLVDGQENPVSVMHSLNLQYEQRYLSLLDYSYGTIVHIINRECFQGLSEAQQNILLEESYRAGRIMRRIARAEEAVQVEEMAGQGLHVTRPDKTLFKERMMPAMRWIEAIFGVENVHLFMDMVERNRDQALPLFS